jgi:hypothetical protein
VLDDVAGVEQECAAGRDQQRLPEPDLFHELGCDPKRQDKKSEELKEPADPIFCGHEIETGVKGNRLAPGGVLTRWVLAP